MPALRVIPHPTETITVAGVTFTNVNADSSPPAILVGESTVAGTPAANNVDVSGITIGSSTSTAAPIRIDSSTAQIKIHTNTLPLAGFSPACRGLVDVTAVGTLEIADSEFTRTVTAAATCTNVVGLHFSSVNTGPITISKDVVNL